VRLTQDIGRKFSEIAKFNFRKFLFVQMKLLPTTAMQIQLKFAFESKTVGAKKNDIYPKENLNRWQ
jgi:hypothetical protein